MRNQGMLGDQVVVKSKVLELWDKVFKNSEEVLKQHMTFGFHGVKNGNPTMEARIALLQAIEPLFDFLLNSPLVGELEYEQQRQILNAKQQITNMEVVAAAVRANKEEDYLEAVAILEKQLPI